MLTSIICAFLLSEFAAKFVRGRGWQHVALISTVLGLSVEQHRTQLLDLLFVPLSVLGAYGLRAFVGRFDRSTQIIVPFSQESPTRPDLPRSKSRWHHPTV